MRRRIMLLLLALFCFSFELGSAQENLLANASGDSGTEYWTVMGDGKIELADGNSYFAVRNTGYLSQKVKIPDSAAGKYALLIGRGSSERMNLDSAITGLPYLYGYFLSVDNPRGGRINTYMNQDTLRLSPKALNEWSIMYGVSVVPKGTAGATIFLNQAERKGVPQNGSAARFDDIGFYIFDTEKAALDFIQKYGR
jgi:hypothetical protein